MGKRGDNKAPCMHKQQFSMQLHTASEFAFMVVSGSKTTKVQTQHELVDAGFCCHLSARKGQHSSTPVALLADRNTYALRSCTVCLQLPHCASLHQTTLWECAVTSEAAKPFLSSSNSATTFGESDNRELQMQA